MLTLLAALALQETVTEREVKAVLESRVKGELKAGFSGQSYPFEYEGWTTLTAEELGALSKEGDVAEALAKRLASAFAQPTIAKEKDKEKKEADPRAKDPKSDDEITGAAFTVAKGRLTGSFTVSRKEGAGTRKLVVKAKGDWEKEKLLLKLDSVTVTGSWDWGGGVAELEGSCEKLEASSRERKKE